MIIKYIQEVERELKVPSHLEKFARQKIKELPIEEVIYELIEKDSSVVILDYFDTNIKSFGIIG